MSIDLFSIQIDSSNFMLLSLDFYCFLEILFYRITNISFDSIIEKIKN